MTKETANYIEENPIADVVAQQIWRGTTPIALGDFEREVF